MPQTCAFAVTSPALWNQLPPLTCSSLLTGEPNASFESLKTLLFGSLAMEAILIGEHCKQHYMNAQIQYNTVTEGLILEHSNELTISKPIPLPTAPHVDSCFIKV